MKKTYRKKTALIIMGVILLAVGALLAIKRWSGSEVEKREPIVEKEKTAKEIAEGWLGQMDLRAKVGQMIILTNSEQDMTEAFFQELMEIKPGGYILMVPNITTFGQTKQMLEGIDKISRLEYGVEGLPMILATDEEGGNVQRLLYVQDKEATDVPYMHDVGKTGDEKLAFEIGKVIGEEVRSLGLNLTFAPDVDVFSNPENEVIGKRSFSEDKDVVAKMALKVASGIESVGVGVAYKHFPGHGDTSIDSHVALPVISKSWGELEQVELYPFRRAIGAGAEMIMVGHIAVNGSEVPASLSEEVVSEILKGKMGFSGLAVTDALNMGAVMEKYTNSEIAVKAVKAGEDLLLMPADVREARDAILMAVERGEITEERIDESVRKILNYKAERLRDFAVGDEGDFGSEAHKKVVQQIIRGE